ncbi:exopolysaccharide biosynthesis protein [Sphingomicrobium astaxanthinifaciens]|uniref:exopolysaccharide biosynthesis protein n=1 Tax=Sphingomicrobium astaxanthinifaciens TaxID=1227949 RepID=UPI001FCAC7E6|nr:exopolysaccharide biosynthesis protein [Sphingomicrobium astaxanthinifaciens]MCJ7421363.1 exopolysaccharide biosynthesis protein [Sphingomicrobium astaxanthinifaciens]
MSTHDSKGELGPVKSVGDIVEGLEEIGEEKACVSVGDIADAFGTRTYAPFLIVPALLEITPLGAIPGVPTILAIIVAIFAVQMLFGRKRIWIPDIIENRRVTGERLRKAAEKAEGVADRMDQWFHRRLRHLTAGVFMKLAAVVILALCAAVPFLEVLPFASSGPMLAIVFIGLALLVRDGLLLVISVSLGLAAVGFGLGHLLMGGGG